MCSLGRGSGDLQNGPGGNFWRQCVLAPRLRGFFGFLERRIFCDGFLLGEGFLS